MKICISERKKAFFLQDSAPPSISSRCHSVIMEGSKPLESDESDESICELTHENGVHFTLMIDDTHHQ